MSLDEETSTTVTAVACSVAVGAVLCSVVSRVGKTGIWTWPECWDSEKQNTLNGLLILKLHLLQQKHIIFSAVNII